MEFQKKTRLTDFASCTGCAAKMSLWDLSQILSPIHEDGAKEERLLIGTKHFDDAGIYKLDGNRALVQTVDFFPPIVDNPRAYGQIAAANALSDVYAMGGKPLTVLNIAGFPRDLEPQWVAEILQGAAEKVHEAGAVVAGGHTIRTGEEVIFGLSVTGEVNPERITANTNAKPGDLLYLTKPLGMGVATTAMKLNKLGEVETLAAEAQMSALNAKACEAMLASQALCATDITGFGLLGHARNIAKASQVTIRFNSSKLPVFVPSVGLAKSLVFSAGISRNKESFGHEVKVSDSVPQHLKDLCFDSETSGGLLIAVSKEKASSLEKEFALRQVAGVRVGEVISKGNHWIELE